MSQLSVEPQIKVTEPHYKRQLKISLGSNEQKQSAPPSQVWLQYSQFNVKTPTNLKFPNKNTSQYVEFSNNLYKDGGTSEYAGVEGDEVEQIASSDQENRKTEVEGKREMISHLSISEEQKNDILGNKQEEQSGKLEWVEMRESMNSRSSYEARDVQGGKRKFVLDGVREQKKPKQIMGCSNCFIM